MEPNTPKRSSLTYLVLNKKKKNSPEIIAPTVSGSGNNEWLAQQLRGKFLITLAPYVPIYCYNTGKSLFKH